MNKYLEKIANKVEYERKFLQGQRAAGIGTLGLAAGGLAYVAHGIHKAMSNSPQPLQQFNEGNYNG